MINGRQVTLGKVKDGVYAKEVKGDRYFAKNPRAICFFDEELLMAHERLGAQQVIVRDTENGITYRAETKTIYGSCGIDLFIGGQWKLCLPLKDWQITGEKDPVMEQGQLL